MRCVSFTPAGSSPGTTSMSTDMATGLYPGADRYTQLRRIFDTAHEACLESPKPRLQRTPSSSPPSPLSRKPLGDEKAGCGDTVYH